MSEDSATIRSAEQSTLSEIWTNPSHRRWIGWAVLAFAFLSVGLHRTSMGVLAETLVRTFEMSGAELGFLHSSFFYLYAALQLPAGIFTDYVGSRKTAVYGTLAMSVGSVVFALSPSYVWALAARALLGVGASVLYLAILRFCANWFRANEFATLSGLTLTVGALGGILATTPLAVAVSRIGWRGSIFGIGIAGILATVAVFLVVRNTPSDAGLSQINGVPPAPTQSVADIKSNLASVLRTPATWLLGVLLFCGIGIDYTIFGLWGIPYLVQSYGLTVTRASTYVLVAGIGWVGGPVVFGVVSDRLETRMPLVLGAVLVISAIWVTFAVVGTVALYVVGALFFITRFMGGGGVLSFTVIKEQFNPSAAGTAMGAINSMGWFGAAVFPVLFGAVLDTFWTGNMINGARVYTETGYRIGFALAAGASLLMVVCAFWTMRRLGGESKPPESE